MKRLILIGLVALLQGCATFSFQNIKDQIPSFWDDNQSRSVIDIRQSVEKLNCKEAHAAQVKVIKDNIIQLHVYNKATALTDKNSKKSSVSKSIKEQYHDSKCIVNNYMRTGNDDSFIRYSEEY